MVARHLFFILSWVIIVHAQPDFPPRVRPVERPPGAPAYSDVCFSSRWPRPRGPEDPHNTFEAARAFHATRLDWVYSTDTTWIQACTDSGYHLMSALNSKLPDEPGSNLRHQGRILDRDGNPVTAPWMKDWKHWWGCVNTPEYRSIFFEHATLCLDGGTDGLQVDDPDMNANAINWGGCFCTYCREKALKTGYDLSDSTARVRFQRQSVREFYADIRRQMDRYAGRHVPLSCNNYRASWTRFPYDLFDFGMAELPEKDAHPPLIHQKLTETRRRHKAQIFVFVSENLSLTRRVIASAYALGGHVMVPWDVYLKSIPTGSIRYFASPKDVADLYGFVRASAPVLDFYEEVFVQGAGIPASADTLISSADSVLISVRARAGDAGQPIVIHLVDWRQTPQPSTLSFPDSWTLSADTWEADVWTPVPYHPASDHRVGQSGEVEHLAHRKRLEIKVRDEQPILSVPPLHPWGMVVMTPVRHTP